MRKKNKKNLLIIVTLLLMAFAITGCGTKPVRVEIPHGKDGTAHKPGFGDESKKYLVRDNPKICVYTIEEDIVWLLVTENTDTDDFPCYGNAFELDFGGQPIALAQDLSSVIIQNDDGKFKVQIKQHSKECEDIPPAEYDEDTDETVYIELYSE